MSDISGISGFSGMSMERPNNVLTEDQQAQAAEIISSYDSENMTQESMQAMRQELNEAGIGPGDDLTEILSSEGFTPTSEVSEGEMPPPPPPPAEEEEASDDVSDAAESLIKTFLDKYNAGEITADDVESIITALNQAGEDSSGIILDEDA